MKIALLSLFNNRQDGGEARVCFELAEELQKRGNDVVVVCPSDKKGLFIGEDGIKRFGIESVGQSSKSIPNLTGKAIEELYLFLDQFAPDILHAHTIAYIGLLGQIWAIRNQKPFIYTAHEILSKISEFFLTSVYLKKIFGGTITNLITKDFISNCDGIISINSYVKDDLKMLEFKNNIYSIPNGRNLNLYQNCKIKEIDIKKIELVFVGIISERKNQQFLINVMRYLPSNFYLNLIGSYENDRGYYRKLKTLIKKDIKDKIKFKGVIPYERIGIELENSDIFVSSSKAEVQSLAVIEALAAGKPVVGLENETISDLIDSKSGLILDKDTTPLEFAESIINFTNKFDPNKVYIASREKAKQFDLQNVVNLTLKAYEDSIKNYKLGQSEEISKRRVDKYIKLIKNPIIKKTLLNIFNSNKIKITHKEVSTKISKRKRIFLIGTATASVVGFFLLKSLSKYKKANNKVV